MDVLIRRREIDTTTHVVEVHLNDEWLEFARATAEEPDHREAHLSHAEREALSRMEELVQGPPVPFFVGPVLCCAYHLSPTMLKHDLDMHGADGFATRHNLLIHESGREFEEQFKAWYDELSAGTYGGA
jgi:hypothetical protein